MMPWCWDRSDAEGQVVTKDRDFKKVGDEALRGTPTAPAVAEMWTNWSRELELVDEPLELLRLAAGYLLGLEGVLDAAANVAVRAGALPDEVRAAVRDRSPLTPRALGLLSIGSKVSATGEPPTSEKRWRPASPSS